LDPKEIVKSGYNKVSSAYRGDTVDLSDPEIQKYAGWIEELRALLPPGGHVLDLGCGNGIPADRLLVDAGCRVSGVDLSPVQVERARSLVPEGEFLCADMSGLDFPAGSFAAIVSFYAMIHLPLAEQPGLFARMYAWLQPGGWLMITVGSEAWTGTENDWLAVPGAQMFWSHSDPQTYQFWLEERGFRVHWTRFIPEGAGGHTLLLARRGV
jgi:cyclopropane fatty-acyl-phospholipid synthase-like methyltransferase